MIRLVAVLALLAGPAAAECRQALALGLDVSGSVDAREYRLQLEGLAAALVSPEVRAALVDPGLPPVRIAVFEWSGAGAQRLLVGWTEIDSGAALEAVAAALVATRRALTDTRTGLGPAQAFGGRLLDASGACPRRTLDLSGDGRANHGPRPDSVPLAPDVTVNGLVIGADAPAAGDLRQMQVSEIVAYYEAVVIRGPDAFVEAALGFEDYEAAMTRKLLREVPVLMLGRPVPPGAAPGPAARPAVRPAAFRPGDPPGDQ